MKVLTSKNVSSRWQMFLGNDSPGLPSFRSVNFELLRFIEFCNGAGVSL